MEKIAAGTRGVVTGGAQMTALEQLVVDILKQAGLNQFDIRTKRELALPGYYHPEKQWDLLVASKGLLVTAIEFKSQIGPSFGNNFNNRVHEKKLFGEPDEAYFITGSRKLRRTDDLTSFM